MKKVILKYLQEKPFDLRKKFPEILDVSFVDDPPRIVVVANKKISLSKVVYNGQKIKVEVVQANEEPENEIAGEDQNIKSWKERHKGIANAIVDPISESINPASKNANNIEAYEAWKKRHNNVKVVK